MAIKQYIIFSNDEFKSVWNTREHWSAILPDTKARIIKLSYKSWLYEYLMRKSFCLKTKKQVNVKKKSARNWLPFSLYHKLHHLPICSSDINLWTIWQDVVLQDIIDLSGDSYVLERMWEKFWSQSVIHKRVVYTTKL